MGCERPGPDGPRTLETQVRRWVIWLGLFALTGRPQLSGGQEHPAAIHGYIRAVHYFGDYWPINFWNSFERSTVDEDFARIAGDGFNAVILVVPWRSFIVGGTPDRPEFDRRYSENLGFLLGRASHHGLSVILRVSYPHDTREALRPRPQDETERLCRDIMLAREPTYSLWLASLAHVGSIASGSGNWIYSFFSWEDLWCAIKDFPGYDDADRRSLAAGTGFQAYVAGSVGLDVMSALEARPLPEPGQVSIPRRGTPAFTIYKRFVEHIFRTRLIPAARSRLPGLGFEARVDMEPIELATEEVVWSAYDLSLGGGLRALYWAPFMGAQNEGETVATEQALKGLSRILDRATGGGRDPSVLLEQFNVVGNTPEFAATSARIAPREVPDFLEMAAPLLEEQTVGYGVWTYKDYRHDYLFNASFERDLDGWTVTGSPTVIRNDEGDRILQIADGEVLRQRVEFRGVAHYATGYGPMAFCARLVRVDGRLGTLTIRLKGVHVGTLTATAESTESCVELRVDYGEVQAFETLDLEVTGAEVQVDDMYLFNHVQSGGIYRVDGTEGPYAAAYRRLNGLLR